MNFRTRQKAQFLQLDERMKFFYVTALRTMSSSPACTISILYIRYWLLGRFSSWNRNLQLEIVWCL